MAKITVRDNGPLLVQGGDVSVSDADGNAFSLSSDTFALCRCGHSRNKPFCDGSHRAAGFEAADRAGGS